MVVGVRHHGDRAARLVNERCRGRAEDQVLQPGPAPSTEDEQIGLFLSGGEDPSRIAFSDPPFDPTGIAADLGSRLVGRLVDERFGVGAEGSEVEAITAEQDWRIEGVCHDVTAASTASGKERPAHSSASKEFFEPSMPTATLAARAMGSPS